MKSLRIKLHGKVYDLTDFNHPGGKKFLEYAANSIDATPIFESNHMDSEKLRNEVLPKYEVKGETYQQLFSPKSWTEGFYPEVKKEVSKWLNSNKKLIETERMKYQIASYILFSIYHISLLYIIFGNLSFFHPLNIFLCFIVGWIKPLIVGIAHDNLHRDKFKSFLFGVGGMDLSKWELDHVFLHHPYTNTKYDIDYTNIQKIGMLPKPLRIFGVWAKMIIINPLIKSFLKFSVKGMDYFCNWLIAFTELLLFYYYGSLYKYLLIFTFALCYFFPITYSNHYLEPIQYSDEPQENWAINQIAGSADFYVFDYNFFDSILAIGLCFQVSHHLFPKIDHVLLPHINPIVKRIAQKYNIKFNPTNWLFSNVPDIIRTIHSDPSKSKQN